MSTPTTRILDKAFKEELARAAKLDKKGIRPVGTEELFPKRTPTNVELVQVCQKVYLKHKAVLDKAVDGAVEFLDSPDGVAYVKALEGSFESAEPNPLSVDIAGQIARNGAFDLTAGAPQGLRGFGIGVSAGVSAVVGLLAGADVVFDFKDEAQVHGRVWKGGSIKGGLSISAGLELSFWVQKPVTGAIAGLLLDLYIPTKYALVLFIRFMYIQQRAEGTTELDFSGVSLQFPLGIGLPLRQNQETPDGVIAAFAAKQTAWDRPRRATLKVVNKATGVGTIAVKETATLELTLTNTSGHDVALSSGATLTINMPSFFSDADISKMTINYPGWTFDDDDGRLTLTLSKNSTWNSGSDIALVITNVASSSQPPAGKQSYPGKVTVGVNDISFTAPIGVTADFSLVWANSQATLAWRAEISQDSGFKLTGDGAGTVTAYAQPGSTIVGLTTAVDKSGVTWVLGYVFNYNTAVTDKVIPQVAAAWWKKDAPKVGNNVFYGTPVDTSGTQAFCWFANTSQSGAELLITPTFG
ncbi:hypothetical protein ABZ319_31990 [Nocardia sp. NPDC005978]|uniref:hypothetical protein n=1 Tax=Nocardia sp. NPDC005978 TaxID=3156725 RepID=UPI0033BBB3D9